MRWVTAVTVLALGAIAALAGGAAAKVVVAVTDPASRATLGLLAVLILGLTLVTAQSRDRTDTPYWR